MKSTLKKIVATTALVFVAGGITIANSTSADAATKDVYNLKQSTKILTVWTGTNCTGDKLSIKPGYRGKTGKWYKSFKQPANTVVDVYYGAFKTHYGPVHSDTCKKSPGAAHTWEKFKIVNVGQGSW